MSPRRSGVAPGTAVVALRRLRLAGPDPLVVETSHLPARPVPGPRDRGLLDGPPVRHADAALRLPSDPRPRDLRAGAPDGGRGGAPRPAPRRAGPAGRADRLRPGRPARSSSAGARSAATATVTPWSCATDDRIRRPADLARELDLGRRDRGGHRRGGSRTGGGRRRPGRAPTGSSSPGRARPTTSPRSSPRRRGRRCTGRSSRHRCRS